LEDEMGINIKFVSNGYEVEVKSSTISGIYVFKFTEEEKMLEFIGKKILDKRVYVKV
jgi:hypothetical protein